MEDTDDLKNSRTFSGILKDLESPGALTKEGSAFTRRLLARAFTEAPQEGLRVGEES